MSKPLPTISVILPVYNSGKMIEKAILSVLDQQYPNVELIVIDGGSTDGTVDIIKRYESHIAYWHSKRDGSCGLAINLGLQQATGDLTIQLMADDWFEPNTFHAIAKAYLAHPDVDIISCGGRIVSYDENREEYQTILSYLDEAKLTLDLRNMCFGIPAMSSRFIKKSFLDKIGLMIPFDEKGKHNFSADRELLIRAAVYHAKNFSIPHLGHTYFSHAKSATFGRKRANQIKIFEEHLTLIESYLLKYSLNATEREILLDWHKDQSVRLVFYYLLENSFRKIYAAVKRGSTFASWAWFKEFSTLPLKVAVKKLYIKFKGRIKYEYPAI